MTSHYVCLLQPGLSSCCRQGSVAALKGSISGDSFDLPLPDSLLHPLERMAPSGPWVFPHPNVWRDKARH